MIVDFELAAGEESVLKDIIDAAFRGSIALDPSAPIGVCSECGAKRTGGELVCCGSCKRWAGLFLCNGESEPCDFC